MLMVNPAAPSATTAAPFMLEERVGFEPTRLAPGCFQDNCLKPLGHLSTAALGRPWQAGQESNLQPADLEAAALPIELPAFSPITIP